VTSDLAVRLGAGEVEEVFRRQLSHPGIQICVREPTFEHVRVRMRCGMATLTDEGPVARLPEDESERRGVWAASFPAAMYAITVLKAMSDAARVR
jgi:hypothetical protein